MKNFTSDIEAADALNPIFKQLKKEISKVIVGQDEVVDRLLIALFCNGHTLLIGVPGLAKTLLISTLARVLDLDFSRIQFTPDLMPSDILGTEILEIDPENGQKYFKFLSGPIFSNLVLADEINRTPPKTQAALLEAMQERHVTVAGKKMELKAPFFVLATQNPIEQEGTYPLPEAQLDRFMFNLKVDYPSFSEEVEIVRSTTKDQNIELSPIIKAEEIIYFQKLIRKVPVADNVIEYAVRLVGKTRILHPSGDSGLKDLLTWGAGPRASQYLILGAKAHALLNGKYSPDIENVRAIALPVLRHRIVPSFHAEAEGISAEDIINKIL
jgi:MoxR-like ATPase